MDNQIQIFNNDTFGNIRIAQIDGAPWFCLTDICKPLGLTSKGVNQRLTHGVTNLYPITDAKGRTQQALFVSESGLYDVVLDARKPAAKAFRKWIITEVLPSIRKHGAYMTDSAIAKSLEDPDYIIHLAKILKEERQARQKVERLNAENRPKVTFADAVAGSNTSCLIGELAKIIRQNGVEMGQNRFFRYLRDHGYLISQGERYNQPMQRYVDAGYFEIKKGVRSGDGGVMHVTCTTKVTPKGQIYFINKFLHAKEENQPQTITQ